MANAENSILYRFSLGIILVLMCFNGFRYLGNSLLWNDEAHTVMTGKYTLEYGYPKVTDGKNMVYADNNDPAVDGKFKNLHPELQATTHSIWAGYYFCAAAVWMADKFKDIYTKTFILRASFLLMGFWGLYLFWRTLLMFLKDPWEKQFLSIAFWVLMLLSVSLILHLREARYYALLVFECGLLAYSYSKWRVDFPKWNWTWFGISALAMALLFYTFYPLYFIFYAAIAAIEGVFLLAHVLERKKSFTAAFVFHFKAGLPVICSLLLVVPSWGFFDVFGSATGALDWRKNISIIGMFFLKYEFLLPALLLKVIALFFIARAWISSEKGFKLSDPKIVMSTALSIAFLVYFVVISRMPQPTYVFTRYFIFLIPVLAGILVLDLLWIREYWKRNRKKLNWLFPAVLVVVLIGSLMHINSKLITWKGRLGELSTPYQGPLDYVIPYLLETYNGNTENLVLATNYEETSFMYYLDCKVTIGFMGNRLEEDVKVRPDVVVYRKYWRNYGEIFQNLLNSGSYQKVQFPVQDFPSNNLPQFDFFFSHQWETLVTNDNSKMLECWIRVE